MTKIELKIESDDNITNANLILMYKDGGMQVKTVDIVNTPQSTQVATQVQPDNSQTTQNKVVRAATTIGEDDAFKRTY